MSRSSQQPSDPACYIEDCRISNLLDINEWVSVVSSFSRRRSGGIKNLQDSHDFLVMYEVKLGESDVLLPPWVYGLS